MTEFEATLRTAPNRFNALAGAALAAKLSGDQEKAKTYYARLLAICQHADGDRPELQDARSLLAEKRAGARVAAGEQTGKPRRGLGQSYGSIVGKPEVIRFIRLRCSLVASNFRSRSA